MRRIVELDAIRGLAAITIVIYHLWFPHNGFLGSAVDLFFVLSGYLITTIILTNEPGARFLASFYARRALRIWPIYYLALLAVVLINPWRHASGDSLADLPYYLTFTQEIPQWLFGGGPTFPVAFRHTWTLAIEEQFYLFWPALLAVSGRKGLPWAASALIALAVIARWAQADMFVLATHTDSLALGGLLAGILDRRRQSDHEPRWMRLGLPVLGVASLMGYALIAAAGKWHMSIYSPSPAFVLAFKPFCLNLAFFAIVGILVKDAGRPRLAWLRGRALVYLGTISYGIYLYHHIIIQYTMEFLEATGRGSSIGVELLEFAASLGLAVLSWECLERPILTLKHRFRYGARAERMSTTRAVERDLAAFEMARG